jgi:hypothetical protein
MGNMCVCQMDPMACFGGLDAGFPDVDLPD